MLVIVPRPATLTLVREYAAKLPCSSSGRAYSRTRHGACPSHPHTIEANNQPFSPHVATGACPAMQRSERIIHFIILPRSSKTWELVWLMKYSNPFTSLQGKIWRTRKFKVEMDHTCPTYYAGSSRWYSCCAAFEPGQAGASLAQSQHRGLVFLSNHVSSTECRSQRKSSIISRDGTVAKLN